MEWWDGVYYIIKYIGYRIIEGKGTNKYFKLLNRKFDLYINFEKNTLCNKAIYTIENVKDKKRITFWLGFREDVEIHSVKINGKLHNYFKLYTLILPMFNYKINYLVIDNLDISKESRYLEVIISYNINVSNHRDDMSTILENYITYNEFHLYNFWYPILGNCINIKEVFEGIFPTPEKCPYEINLSMSQDGIAVGEGDIIKKSDSNYIIKNYNNELNDIFICGGRLRRTSYSIDNVKVNFYYTSSRHQYYGKSHEVLFKGIKYIIDILKSFHQEIINIYCLPIIAGGYGLKYSIIVNENYFLDSNTIDSKHKYRLVWHEFIHHWWGSRISGSRKGKYLLTEGMTVLFEWLTVKHVLGREVFDLVIEDAVEEVLEIVGFEKSISNANRVPPFGNVIIYNKIPLVLYQLLNKVGENIFIKCCQDFLKEPGIYEWEDFFIKLQEYSSLDLVNYSDKWIYEKEIPIIKENNYEILIDKRTDEKKQFDYRIAKYRKDKNHKKLLEWLLHNEPLEEFWNKYYYYLCICYLNNNDYEKANWCIEQLDIKRDKKYYWEGMYQKAIYEYKQNNIKKSKKIIDTVLNSSYPIKNLRNLLIIYSKIEDCAENIKLIE